MASTPYKNNQEELEHSISHGVSFDNINLRNVSFWMIFGIFLLTIILYGLYNMYTYNQFLSSERAAINMEFHDLNAMREREQQLLNTLELIDEENRRYRIPIDSAMALMADEYP
ncbi:MAG: hypothetical protein WD097_02475 [Balneolales bacterium]